MNESSDTFSSKVGLLSIQERMRAIGGSFTIDSMLGKGTTATLCFALSNQRRSTAEMEGLTGGVKQRQSLASLIASPAPKAPTTIKIFLVDDQAMIREGLRMLLEGYSDIVIVGEASSGQEAVMEVERLLPDVVIMDINMPTMNGIEATRLIKARYPETIIIGLSINADEGNQKMMAKAGATSLIPKEAAVDELYLAIQEARNQSPKTWQ